MRRLNYPALHIRYAAGETGMTIAAEVGVTPSTLYRGWHRHGLAVRSGSAAKLLLHQQRPELRQTIAIAQAARRGNHDPMTRRVQRAQTREAKLIGVSQNEERLAERLAEAGIPCRRQVAIGPYNVDFAFDALRLVLEIDGGGHNPRVRANRSARREFIRSEGWTVAHVQTRRARWLDVAMEIVHASASNTHAPDESLSIRIR